MKHINKYNKFIKLNENIEIHGNINDYDINIIKDALLELLDLGCKIESINKKSNDNIDIRLMIKTEKITKGIHIEYFFNKKRVYKKIEKNYSDDILLDYIPNEYEKNIINIIKDCSILLLNMLEYNKGKSDFWYMAQLISYIEIKFKK